MPRAGERRSGARRRHGRDRPASVEQALDAAEARFGPVTVVVNNAGITSTGPRLDIDEADWDGVSTPT